MSDEIFVDTNVLVGSRVTVDDYWNLVMEEVQGPAAATVI